MLARLHAQSQEVRLSVRIRSLRRRERLALRRLGEDVARTGVGEDQGLARLIAEIGEGERQAAALLAECRTSLEADRADLCLVASWVKPLVVLRGLCTRLVLRQRAFAHRRALGPRLEALGDLVTRSSGQGPGPDSQSREVVALRSRLALLVGERDRWGAPYGGRALPTWTTQVAGEATMFGRAVATQLRPHLLPKAPAIAGMGIGWWIANTYTDSHLRSALRSLGLGSGGTRVVSSSTYETMTFWLPLLGAALCAYLGGRLNAYYRTKTDPDP
jgi:hypothetical protein